MAKLLRLSLARLLHRYRRLKSLPAETSCGRKMSRYIFEPRFFVALMLMLVLYFIAASIGSGWMFLLSAGFLAALMAALVCPMLALWQIRVKSFLPTTAVAGQPFQATVILSKPKSAKFTWLPQLPAQYLLVKQEIHSASKS